MKANKGLSLCYDIVSIFVTAAVIIAVLFTFFFRLSGINGSSMEDTLHDGDWVLLSQLDYTEPEYGDIVVISQPNDFGENIVKRVIATGGQTIDIDFETGDVYIDGEVLEENYIKNATIDQYDVEFPLTVPEGYCFVMGDNRQDSLDSRSSHVGLIRNDYVLGIARFAKTATGFQSLTFHSVA